MRAAYLDEAQQDQVSQVIRDVLHEKGALISDHSIGRVRFRDYKPSGKHTWDRGGYVGIYQHEGEKEVEVRLLLRARWPYRILWMVALVNVIAAIVTFIVNPSGTAWSAVAGFGALGLISAFILYVNTWKPVNREERALIEDLEAAFAEGFDDVETADAREERLFEERIEAELESQRIAKARKDEPDIPRRKLALPKPDLSSFKLKRAKKATAPSEPDDAAQAKRARIIALKAKLAKQRGEEVAVAPAAPATPAQDAPVADEPARKGFRMPKFGKKPLKSQPEPEDETPEERRARLLARKAELEAQREDK